MGLSSASLCLHIAGRLKAQHNNQQMIDKFVLQLYSESDVVFHAFLTPALRLRYSKLCCILHYFPICRKSHRQSILLDKSHSAFTVLRNSKSLLHHGVQKFIIQGKLYPIISLRLWSLLSKSTSSALSLANYSPPAITLLNATMCYHFKKKMTFHSQQKV
jgi:hypothetical protein